MGKGQSRSGDMPNKINSHRRAIRSINNREPRKKKRERNAEKEKPTKITMLNVHSIVLVPLK